MPSVARRPRAARVLVWCVISACALIFAFLVVERVFFRERVVVNEAELQKFEGAALTAYVPPKATGDWPQWRGPNRDGVATDGLLLDWPKDGPKRLWTQPTGEGFSSMVVARGRVFTMFQDGPRETVACWDAETGKEIWRFGYDSNYRNKFGNGPRSTPCVAGEYLYTVGGTGVMHCLKAFTDNPQGEKVWRRDLLDEFGGSNLKWGISFSPLVDDKRVYVMPGGPGACLAALDRDTGATVWKALDDAASYSSPLPATFGGKELVLIMTADRFVGVEPATGAVRLEHPWRVNNEGCSIATPLVLGDYIFLAAGYNKGCALLKIEPAGDGFKATPVYESTKLMRSQIASCVRQGNLVFGFDDTNLVCLDLRSDLKKGKVRWREHGFGKGALLLADGHLIIQSEDGRIALAEATADEYREKARFEFSREPSTWTLPVLVNGRLYVRDQAQIACYDVRKR